MREEECVRKREKEGHSVCVIGFSRDSMSVCVSLYVGGLSERECMIGCARGSVCVCERERERRSRVYDKLCEGKCVFVCVCVCV